MNTSILPRVIGICGYKQSGKDTISEILQQYGYDHIKISNTLKAVTKLLFDFTDDQVNGEKKDIVDNYWGISPRQMMQFIGTDVMQFEIQKVMKDVGRNFWINRLIQTELESCKSRCVVISDLRFKHEYEALKKYGLYVIQVNRPSLLKNDSHISESEFLTIPANEIIINDGSKRDLEEKIKRLMTELMEATGVPTGPT